MRPVPTGTDCSVTYNRTGCAGKSRPYGDGLFCLDRAAAAASTVPSLRGRIVPSRMSYQTGAYGPVPTGTDCSQNSIGGIKWHLSRPYGDGLFFSFVRAVWHVHVPSLRGRIVPDQPEI